MQAKGKMKIGRKKELIFYWAILAFPLIQFAVFYIGVNFNSILLAFREYDVNEGTYSFAAFENFRIFWIDLTQGATLNKAFVNSLLVYLISTVVIMPAGILFSYYIYKKRFMSGVFKVFLFLPSIISSIVMVLMYKYFVERALPTVLLKLFGVELNLSLLKSAKTAMGMILVFLVWSGFGTGMVLFTGAMSRVPEELVESASLDGINYLKELRYITLPLIYPTITVFLVTGVAGFFTNQAALYSFYGPQAQPYVMTYGYYIFVKVVQNSSSMADFPYAAAAGLIFTLVAAPITLIIKWALEKFGPNTEY